MEYPKVLLVEDDLLSQQYVRSVLGKRYQVLSAIGAEEAREILRDHAVQIILMDLTLKGSEDGIQLTRHIRNTPGISRLPIIAVTAHVFSKDRRNALDAGCNDFLPKPVSPQNLLYTVEKWLYVFSLN